MSQISVVILGAGPAGLSAGYELAKKGVAVNIVEKDSIVGGISRTVEHNGFRFDIGGHRFFTKMDRVNKLWDEILGDEFLTRPRISRIYYNHKFFDYPLKISNTFKNLGPIKSFEFFLSYLGSKIQPYPREDNLEQWVSNRFGRKLYRAFFKTYTEKVWNIPCDQIEAEWAAQRIKGLSFSSAVRAALLGNSNGKIKSLIDEFKYPRLGPGQMYETMAEKIREIGGKMIMNTRVTKLTKTDNTLASVEVTDSDGTTQTLTADHILSSIPLTELVQIIDDSVPDHVCRAAEKLSYRSLLTINLMMNRPESFPDTWIYIHSPKVKVGRVQCFKNWSPHMVPDSDQSSLGLEYFCTEGDSLWNAADADLVELGKNEIAQLELADPTTVFDAFVIRTPKTYPVYMANYREHLAAIKDYVTPITNLQCIGRNGMFKYNNMDHSILTGLLAADNILGADNDLWTVNTETAYHEQTEN
ncbi:15-cis-phytoene desaturase [Anaerohalosphaera lusitana]|uniref:15-cis-phytoene desaturase n=1 Tax=Anaerohalosphaera lusitana TaxID=1936003 RepID=A0A1U9NIL6_9BACT|nr:NAD(P)/FAD-dependent oxidoreductase [Anaerohalosphaera lusitana]AQT67346.1 15-cis-phytoene desaturase [Anaerohalosphaera lusitana]